MKDYIVRATAANSQIRAFAATTREMVEFARAAHNTSPVATAALGRLLTAGSMMGIMMKGEKDLLTLQVKAGGPLNGMTVTADSKGNVKGYVGNPNVVIHANEKGKLDVGSGVGQGILSVTRFTGLKDPITGSCEIVSGEIAEDLTNYLYTSEQTPSSVGLGVLVNPDLKVAAAGGFILQLLPDATEETLTKLENNLAKIRPVSTMVKDGLDARGIIAELLQGFDKVDYLTTTDLAFKCQCSKERIEDVLISLNEHDLKSLVDDGHAEVCCHFCGEKYQFNKDELTAIYNVSQKLKDNKANN